MKTLEHVFVLFEHKLA